MPQVTSDKLHRAAAAAAATAPGWAVGGCLPCADETKEPRKDLIYFLFFFKMEDIAEKAKEKGESERWREGGREGGREGRNDVGRRERRNKVIKTGPGEERKWRCGLM